MNYTVCFKKACGTIKMGQFSCGSDAREVVEDIAREKIVPEGAKLLWVAKSDNTTTSEKN